MILQLAAGCWQLAFGNWSLAEPNNNFNNNDG
jgi:hypothetical protein